MRKRVKVRGVGLDLGNDSVLAFEFGRLCVMGQICPNEMQIGNAGIGRKQKRLVDRRRFVSAQQIEHAKERT